MKSNSSQRNGEFQFEKNRPKWFQIRLNDDSANGVFTVQQNGFAVIAASLSRFRQHTTVCVWAAAAGNCEQRLKFAGESVVEMFG